MPKSNKPISPLRQRMMEDMRLWKLSETTQTQYIRGVVRLTTFLGRSPDTAAAEDLRRFQRSNQVGLWICSRNEIRVAELH